MPPRRIRAPPTKPIAPDWHRARLTSYEDCELIRNAMIARHDPMGPLYRIFYFAPFGAVHPGVLVTHKRNGCTCHIEQSKDPETSIFSVLACGVTWDGRGVDLDECMGKRTWGLFMHWTVDPNRAPRSLIVCATCGVSMDLNSHYETRMYRFRCNKHDRFTRWIAFYCTPACRGVMGSDLPDL